MTNSQRKSGDENVTKKIVKLSKKCKLKCLLIIPNVAILIIVCFDFFANTEHNVGCQNFMVGNGLVTRLVMLKNLLGALEIVIVVLGAHNG